MVVANLNQSSPDDGSIGDDETDAGDIGESISQISSVEGHTDVGSVCSNPATWRSVPPSPRFLRMMVRLPSGHYRRLSRGDRLPLSEIFLSCSLCRHAPQYKVLSTTAQAGRVRKERQTSKSAARAPSEASSEYTTTSSSPHRAASVAPSDGLQPGSPSARHSTSPSGSESQARKKRRSIDSGTTSLSRQSADPYIPSPTAPSSRYFTTFKARPSYRPLPSGLPGGPLSPIYSGSPSFPSPNKKKTRTSSFFRSRRSTVREQKRRGWAPQYYPAPAWSVAPHNEVDLMPSGDDNNGVPYLGDPRGAIPYNAYGSIGGEETDFNGETEPQGSPDADISPAAESFRLGRSRTGGVLRVGRTGTGSILQMKKKGSKVDSSLHQRLWGRRYMSKASSTGSGRRAAAHTGAPVSAPPRPLSPPLLLGDAPQLPTITDTGPKKARSLMNPPHTSTTSPVIPREPPELPPSTDHVGAPPTLRQLSATKEEPSPGEQEEEEEEAPVKADKIVVEVGTMKGHLTDTTLPPEGSMQMFLLCGPTTANLQEMLDHTRNKSPLVRVQIQPSGDFAATFGHVFCLPLEEPLPAGLRVTVACTREIVRTTPEGKRHCSWRLNDIGSIICPYGDFTKAQAGTWHVYPVRLNQDAKFNAERPSLEAKFSLLPESEGPPILPDTIEPFKHPPPSKVVKSLRPEAEHATALVSSTFFPASLPSSQQFLEEEFLLTSTQQRYIHQLKKKKSLSDCTSLASTDSSLLYSSSSLYSSPFSSFPSLSTSSSSSVSPSSSSSCCSTVSSKPPSSPRSGVSHAFNKRKPLVLFSFTSLFKASDNQLARPLAVYASRGKTVAISPSPATARHNDLSNSRTSPRGSKGNIILSVPAERRSSSSSSSSDNSSSCNSSSSSNHSTSNSSSNSRGQRVGPGPVRPSECSGNDRGAGSVNIRADAFIFAFKGLSSSSEKRILTFSLPGVRNSTCTLRGRKVAPSKQAMARTEGRQIAATPQRCHSPVFSAEGKGRFVARSAVATSSSHYRYIAIAGPSKPSGNKYNGRERATQSHVVEDTKEGHAKERGNHRRAKEDYPANEGNEGKIHEGNSTSNRGHIFVMIQPHYETGNTIQAESAAGSESENSAAENVKSSGLTPRSYSGKKLRSRTAAREREKTRPASSDNIKVTRQPRAAAVIPLTNTYTSIGTDLLAGRRLSSDLPDARKSNSRVGESQKKLEAKRNSISSLPATTTQKYGTWRTFPEISAADAATKTTIEEVTVVPSNIVQARIRKEELDVSVAEEDVPVREAGETAVVEKKEEEEEEKIIFYEEIADATVTRLPDRAAGGDIRAEAETVDNAQFGRTTEVASTEEATVELTRVSGIEVVGQMKITAIEEEPTKAEVYGRMEEKQESDEADTEETAEVEEEEVATVDPDERDTMEAGDASETEKGEAKEIEADGVLAEVTEEVAEEAAEAGGEVEGNEATAADIQTAAAATQDERILGTEEEEGINKEEPEGEEAEDKQLEAALVEEDRSQGYGIVKDATEFMEVHKDKVADDDDDNEPTKCVVTGSNRSNALSSTSHRRLHQQQCSRREREYRDQETPHGLVKTAGADLSVGVPHPVSPRKVSQNTVSTESKEARSNKLAGESEDFVLSHLLAAPPGGPHAVKGGRITKSISRNTSGSRYHTQDASVDCSSSDSTRDQYANSNRNPIRRGVALQRIENYSDVSRHFNVNNCISANPNKYHRTVALSCGSSTSRSVGALHWPPSLPRPPPRRQQLQQQEADVCGSDKCQGTKSSSPSCTDAYRRPRNALPLNPVEPVTSGLGRLGKAPGVRTFENVQTMSNALEIARVRSTDKVGRNTLRGREHHNANIYGEPSIISYELQNSTHQKNRRSATGGKTPVLFSGSMYESCSKYTAGKQQRGQGIRRKQHNMNEKTQLSISEQQRPERHLRQQNHIQHVRDQEQHRNSELPEQQQQCVSREAGSSASRYRLAYTASFDRPEFLHLMSVNHTLTRCQKRNASAAFSSSLSAAVAAAAAAIAAPLQPPSPRRCRRCSETLPGV